MNKIILALIALFLTSSCGSKISYPAMVTSSNKASKTGRDCIKFIFFPPGNIKFSTDSAKADGNIKTIAYGEYEEKHWPFYNKKCLVVYGE